MKLYFILALTTLTQQSQFHPHDLFLPTVYTEDEYCLYHEHEATPENIKCNLCIASILNSENRCQAPKAEIAHCLFYNRENSCKTCQYNYKPSEDSETCVKIAQKNCLQTSKDNKCTVCNDRIMAVDGECDKQNLCTLENCEVCGMRGGVEYCYVCDDGFATYFESDGDVPVASCRPEGEDTQNCSLLTPGNVGECAICDVGFYENKDDLCVKSEAYDIDLFGGVKVFVGVVVGVLCLL